MTPLALLALHGGLMTLGFAFCTTIAALIAIFRQRFLKLFGVKPAATSEWKDQRWFDLHLMWQLLGFFSSTVGLIVVYLAVDSEQKEGLRPGGE